VNALGRAAVADRFAAARAVADAVIYEGYVLYPYRASATKNRIRWQFGVLAPPEFAAADDSERSVARTECIVDPGRSPRLTVRVRFLHVQRRIGGAAEPWDEAVEEQIDIEDVALLPLERAHREVQVHLDGSEVVTDGVLRRREPIDGIVRVGAESAQGSGAFVKVIVTVENRSPCAEPVQGRAEAMRRSLVAVHMLLAVDDGRFVSLLDPPGDAVGAVQGCRSEGTHPVLVGDGVHDVILSSPIILYDHPAVAGESEGDLFDATEIDEILALRVLTLTDEEKAEARGTDPRAAAIVDRIDGFTPDVWARMHGTMRPIDRIGGSAGTADDQRDDEDDDDDDTPESVPWWGPAVDEMYDPFTDTLVMNGRTVGAGTAVVLHPSRRADAHDMFLVGLTATVTGVFTDVDREVLVAVRVDDDPASAELAWQGRALFFHPDELEVVDDVAPPGEQPRMRVPRVLVAGIGNVLLGDDGFGVEVANRMLTMRMSMPEGVRVDEFGIRGIHLAYELLDGYDALVLIDAVPMGEPPGTLVVMQPDAPGRPADDEEEDIPESGLDAHSMNPDVVLGVLAHLGGAIENVYVIGCQPADLDEGMGLSPSVAAAIDPAVELCSQLLDEVVALVEKESER
jgi:hydrogenase maturation protease